MVSGVGLGLVNLNEQRPHSTIVKTSLLKLWSLHFIKVLNVLCSHIGQDVISFNWCFTWNDYRPKYTRRIDISEGLIPLILEA